MVNHRGKINIMDTPRWPNYVRDEISKEMYLMW